MNTEHTSLGWTEILSNGSICAALIKRRRDGAQKSLLMAMPLSFGKPTASLNALSPSTEAASVATRPEFTEFWFQCIFVRRRGVRTLLYSSHYRSLKYICVQLGNRAGLFAWS
jgi:hypothetical protein